MRSSATSEDTEETSFAGINETFANVSDSDELLARIVDCWASLYGSRAIADPQRAPAWCPPKTCGGWGLLLRPSVKRTPGCGRPSRSLRRTAGRGNTSRSRSSCPARRHVSASPTSCKPDLPESSFPRRGAP
ncbi:MAG: hypothetical protein M3O70_16720 [Actinomycetota bacterium]|nr:hypothetical protein [Actinomycetota bacterium]